MRETWFWKLTTLIACLGWLGTWVWRGDEASPEPSPTVVPAASPSPLEQARTRALRPPEQAPRRVVVDTGAPAVALDPVEAAQDPVVMDIARELVLEELEEEREQRHEEHRQERLDELHAFADEYGLDSAQREALVEAFQVLEQSMERVHDQRREEGEPGPPGPEEREAMDEAFAAFEGEIEASLGSELGAELQEWMRPAGGPPPR